MCVLSLKDRPFTSDEYYNDLVAKNCPRNGHFKYRNKLILDLLAIVGLRPRELCLLAPRHFMCPEGTFSEFLLISEEWSFNGNERPVVLSHDEVKRSLTDYVKWMVEFGINTTPDKSYLGIDPNKPILVDENYKFFGLQSRGKNKSETSKLIPQKINDLIKELIKKSGLEQGNVGLGSFHRTWVINHFRAGIDIKSLSVIAGISEQTVMNYLAYDPKQYIDIVEWFDERNKKKAALLESRKKRRRYELRLD